MTVQNYINAFRLENDNPYSDATLLKYINLLESNLDIIKDYRVQTYAMVIGEYQYTLPEGVTFEDVYGLRVNGVKYDKVDTREYKKPRTFWYEGNKLCIYPACSVSDTGTNESIRLVYKYRPPTKLIGNISTDELYLSDKWIDLYDTFLSAKIALLQKEYTDHNNAMIVYNSRLNDLEQWWENNRPSRPEEEITPQDSYMENVGFDYE